ncbi:hypothetical protein [Pseudomaricurvus sp. HS19]|uniref:hypothetical protein n=1 Tax=Pseudomaricurvus sp. HS19 TaxID=2692626 RepID=UPI001369E262|nr:hypothetical protein [Pseudomaricurvus sp. HS19]MYM64728.1 hypothetical protein [Pseudomaricurvus sp. HS19]
MMKRKLLLSTLLAATVASAGALAFDGDTKGRGDCDGKGPKHEMREHGGFKGGKHMDRRAMMERKFNADQINTLVSARLLMQGNENIKVGKVTPTDSGFNVTVVTQDNSLVEELQLAPNGMPLEKFERMQQRMQERAEAKAS